MATHPPVAPGGSLNSSHYSIILGRMSPGGCYALLAARLIQSHGAEEGLKAEGSEEAGRCHLVGRTL